MSEHGEVWVELYASTRYVGSDVTHRIELVQEGFVPSREAWEALSEEGQNEILRDELEIFLFDEVDYGFREVDGDF